MPTSGGHRRQQSGRGLRTPPGYTSRDPLVELAINGEMGGVDIASVGRGGEIELTITNDVVRFIHPTGYNEDGTPIRLGLVDPYTVDGPFIGGWSQNRVYVMGSDGSQGGNGMGVFPFGSVILAVGWKWTGGDPGGMGYHTQFGSSFWGTSQCGIVELLGTMRSEPECVEYTFTDVFCFIFPNAPGCQQCGLAGIACHGEAYKGVGLNHSVQQSGDIMIFESVNTGSRRSFYTGANKMVFRQTPEGNDEVPPLVPQNPSSLDIFADNLLGFGIDNPSVTMPKAFSVNLGPSFAENPEPRVVRFRVTDPFNYDFTTYNGSGVGDPGGETFYHPGSTNYQLTLRAYAGGGDTFVAEPGTTRVGAPMGRNYKARIGSNRGPASGVRPSVAGTDVVR